MKNLFILLIICTALLACEKNPGEGGTSVITGQVYEFDLYQNPNTGEWDTIFYKLDIGKDIFIIYSNDYELIYDDKFETDYNGRYRFEYLRKGEYTLYTYARLFTFIFSFTLTCKLTASSHYISSSRPSYCRNISCIVNNL